MKILKLVLSMFCVMWAATSKGQSPTFRYSYNVGLFDISGGMVQTPTGGFTVAGLNNSSGPYYGNVFNMNAQGAIQWSNAYTAGFASSFNDIKNVSTGGYIVTGQSTSSGGGAILLRLDAAGNIIWGFRYQCPDFNSSRTSNEYGNAVIETSDGGFVVGGGVDYFWDGVSGTTVDTASAMGFKVNSAGVLQWSRVWTISTANPDEHYINDVVETADGYIFVGQSSEGSGTLSGNGDYPSNALVVKTDKITGNLTYIRRWGAGNTSSQGISCATTLSTGNVLLGGFDDTHTFVISISGTGSGTPSVIFNRRINGSPTNIHLITEVMENSDGNYSMLGTWINLNLFPPSQNYYTVLGKINSSNNSWMFGRAYQTINGLGGILPEGGLASDQGYYMSYTDQQFSGFNYNVIRTDATGQVAATPSGCPGIAWTPGLNTIGVTFTTPTNAVFTPFTGSAATFAITAQTVTPVQHCLNVPSVLSATATSTNVNCFGQCTGTATATPSGGTPGYTYSWAPSGGNAATATGLCAGTYTCTITDAASATTTVSVNITQPASAVSASIPTSTNVACNGGCTGSATAAGAGGTPGYTYSWAPSGGNAATASALCAGGYTVTVTDANGCTTTQSITITQPPALSGSATSTPSGCAATTGTATATPTGGVGPYTYNWLPSGGTAATATNLGPGSYTCVITDANGCTFNAITTVSTTSGPTASLQSQNDVDCNGNTNGSATVNVTGGNPGYTYSWAPSGGNAATASGLGAGTYTCTITDQSGCVTSQIVTITQPAPLNALGNSTSSGCTNTGSASVTPSGGSPSYSYLWSTGGTNSSISNVGPGNYTCVVTDANGCTTTATVTVTLGTPITVTTNASSSTICDNTTATLTASGATTYTWQPGNLTGSSITINPSTTTTYTVIGVTGTNCADTTTQLITVNPAPGLTVGSLPTTICQGDSAIIGVSGAATYLWQPGNLTDSVLVVYPNTTTTYTVIGTNTAGCSDTTTVTVTVTGPPNVTASASTTTTCVGNPVTLTASGASTYTWNPGNLSGSSISVTPSSTTTYTVVGANGSCSDTTTITINVAPGPVVNITSSNASVCPGTSVQLTASGAVSYVWSSGGTTATETVTPATSQTYTVTGTDANGCIGTATFSVTVFPAPQVNITGNNLVCTGNSTTLTATGATNYVWSNSSVSTSITVTPTTTTSYSVIGTDANGCVDTATVTVSTTAPPVANITGDTSICAGSSTILTATGGGTYSWNTGGTSSLETVSPTATTTYTVVVSNGACTDTATITVNVLTGPTANAGSDVTISLGNSTTLSGTGGGTYSWSPSTGLNNTIMANPTASPTVTTTYTLVVTDANGCTSIDSVTVFVTLECGELFVPNIFSPNADGHNDEFKVYYSPYCFATYQLIIFDRWGQAVFESVTPGEAWDGTFKGKELNSAVFAYILKATLINGEEVEKHGNVTLVK